MPQFVANVEEIRRRAQRKLEEGAVVEGYQGSVEHTIQILNEALATEIVCVLRYMHHYFMATGVHGRSVAGEFKEHADDEREHADLIAERIQQLGGKPDFNPRSLLERSVSQYIEGETLAEMIREDLIAERIVIEVYQQMVRHFGANDPTTRIIVERILEEEEEHASDLADLLYITDPQTGATEGQDPGADPLHISTKRHEEASRSHREPQPQDDFLRSEHLRTEVRSSERAETEPLQPGFNSRSENASGGWRPGESNLRASDTTAKRHESHQAGPPGSPEFSAAKQRPSSREAKDRGKGRRKKPAA